MDASTGSDALVTPWEVKGSIDYGKLIREFGLEELPPLPQKFQEFSLFRRGIIFAHRDFGKIIEAYKNKQPFAMMTGLMPSGRFHFGHKMIADEIIFYQGLGAKIYIAVADIEAYNSRSTDLAELRRVAVEEYLTNYVALGLDLSKCDFYFQSYRSKDAGRANAYYSLAGELARHASFNEFQAVYGEISPGKMASSLLQAADMLHPQLPEFDGKAIPTVIPVGPDQDPHIRLARDISQRYKLCRLDKISSTYHIFMPGLKGGKMSSSDEMSYIALTDSSEAATRKIMKYAFSGGQPSIEEHRRLGGNPEIDVSFQMLRFGLEDDDKKLEQIYSDYKSGRMLTGELKGITAEKISAFLKEHQARRGAAKRQIEKYMKGRFW